MTMSGATRDLWPSDIKTDEVLSPFDIMSYQAQQLAARTGSLLAAEVVRSESPDRVSLVFEVYAPRIDRRMQLFTVQHRKDFDYPAAILAPNSKLPTFLQKRYYQPGPAEIFAAPSKLGEVVSSVFTAKGQWVENELLATSPTEFTDILGSVLAQPTVKASIISLISRSNEIVDLYPAPQNGEPTSESVDDSEPSL
jgi:hypothetical protein